MGLLVMCLLWLFLLFRYLDETVLFLLNALKIQKEKTTAFQAIGLLSISVGEKIRRYVGRIMEIVRVSLPTRDLQAK